MSDYEVGYGKPPKHSRFKKGVCPNPRGCGKKRDHQLGDIVLKVLSAKTEFRERGQIKQGSRMELAIRRHFAAALNGDVASAALLLKIRRHAERYGDPAQLIVNIINSPQVQARKHRAEATRGQDCRFSLRGDPKEPELGRSIDDQGFVTPPPDC